VHGYIATVHRLRSLLQGIVRPLLAWVFVGGGVDVLRNPGPRVATAAPTIDQIRTVVPVLPDDNETVVRLNAGAQIAAGVALALGKVPRLAALTLAGSLIPTTYAGHAFWKISDDQPRAMQRVHFNKNLAILGGLLFVATS